MGDGENCETVQNGEYELKIEPEHCKYIYFVFVIGHYYVVKHLQSCQCIMIMRSMYCPCIALKAFFLFPVSSCNKSVWPKTTSFPFASIRKFWI